MASADDVIRVAAGEIGYHEGPDNDNKYGRWYGMNHAFWCYIFCQWVFAQAGTPLPFRTAYVPYGATWARQNGMWRPSTQSERGDLIIFDWTGTGQAAGSNTHIGIVESHVNGTVQTIEGNRGDSVCRRSYVAGENDIAGTINCQPLFAFHPHPTDNRFQVFPTVQQGIHDLGATGTFPDIAHPVGTLQNALNIVNHKEAPQPGALSPDGVFGGMTANAVRAFQTAESLAADSVVGQRTWATLDHALDRAGR
ncbi:peptidoglycan-binding protein [Pseudofrankia inefficax]|uniref:Peptidoglycan-binding domain 1 protein n=1 Tax=Pseudofrankia inefficax (strain DSM 45817 / CECT 9037 / DDB 130130 / EuI1c) TaxID=298654 RepID=E3IWP2_PSEI1|nr:peptidoglycan-binding protein [Pseudofrankia inefficax]ADP81372.1 Peptidoglycan-binding domain 1 protein [Pseudofrankia inefficax]